MLAKRCGVLLHKDITNTSPKVVYEHEIPVLNFKFGAKNVERTKMDRFVVINPKQAPVQRGFKRWPIVEIDHDEEFSRLLLMYGKHETNGQICVEMAFGFVDERRLETQNEAKYRPMITAGHTFIKPEPIPEEEYSDGMSIFEPEDIAPAPEPNESTASGADEPASKPYESPLSDQETMFKIGNMTIDGIQACLEDRGVEFDEKLSKAELHKVFMDSMKPVGVDPEQPEEE